MIGLLLLALAALVFVASLIAGSEIGATASLIVGGIILVALIFGAYARLGLWLWGL